MNIILSIALLFLLFMSQGIDICSETLAQPSGSPPGVSTQGEVAMSLVNAGSATLLSLPAAQNWQGQQTAADQELQAPTMETMARPWVPTNHRGH